MKRILTLVLALMMIFTVCASAEGYTIGYSLSLATLLVATAILSLFR